MDLKRLPVQSLSLRPIDSLDLEHFPRPILLLATMAIAILVWDLQKWNFDLDCLIQPVLPLKRQNVFSQEHSNIKRTR